ncbi:protein of unknown function [Lutibacter agarilyticus]|uniref:DUF4271 domain-containing protein n=1 Tax=Lutibacter agarilyticus TaxID=1109740 RepID=A0A238W0E1_9FLAO|nr:DUF4271 domain-containing protein [Lutibacter agarilyticus]SNR39834.1 protein of unknown function [Lutibacter agarilyticus]
MFEAKEIISQNNDWIALIFLTIFIILVVIKLSFSERLNYTSTLFFSKKNFATYANKENRNIFNMFQILFFVIQLLVFSLLFYELLAYLKPTFKTLNLYNFLIILAGVFLYFALRYLIGVFLASIFNLSEIYKKMVYEKTNYLNSLCISILPFLLFLFYTDNYKIIFSRITLILFVFLLLVRYAWVIRNNKKLIFNNLLYFILYLCALEIAPLVIILKLTI